MKQIIWLGNSRNRLKSFPPDTQDIAGYQLFKIQCGGQANDWRNMSDIAAGVIEIRLHQPNEYRVLYIATYIEAIYILNCFEKKTNKAPTRHLEIARKNYADLQERRQKTK